MLEGPQKSRREAWWESGHIYRVGRERAGSDSLKRVLGFAYFSKVIMNSAPFHSQLCPVSEGKPDSPPSLNSPPDALND